MPMKSMIQVRQSASLSQRGASVSTIALTTVLLTWGVLAGVAMAAMLAPKAGEEAGPKDWPANPASHQSVITREAMGNKQSAMISAAEAAQAPREAVLKEAARKDPGADANEPVIPEGGNVWWYQEKLGIRIPYAITGDAITYFSELVASNAKKPFKSYGEPSSRLDYHAGVKFHKEFKLADKTFKDVNVVSLQLRFAANFTASSTAALSFEKKRVVVLDADNKVLHISGDGPTEAMIMML